MVPYIEKRKFINFTWKNEVMNDIKINSINVKIYQVSNQHPFPIYSGDIISTDGKRIGKNLKTCVNFSYITTSTGIVRKENSKFIHYKLYIKLYVSSGFDIEKLEQLDFCGKQYVITALQTLKISKTEPTEPAPIPEFPPAFLERIGCKSAEIYQQLAQLAKEKDIESIEKIFDKYPLTFNYQAKFWKYLFQKEIANQEKE